MKKEASRNKMKTEKTQTEAPLNKANQTLPPFSKRGRWITVTMVFMIISLILMNLYIMRENKKIKEENDSMNLQPVQLSVVINKLIYDFISPQFSLPNVEDFYFNDLFEIKTNSIDLFYVPK